MDARQVIYTSSKLRYTKNAMGRYDKKTYKRQIPEDFDTTHWYKYLKVTSFYSKVVKSVLSIVALKCLKKTVKRI